MPTNDLSQAWSKITGADKDGIQQTMGRAGLIPIFEAGTWRVLRNTHTIYEPAENCASPVKVEQLRRNARSLMNVYPDTGPALEKLGMRIRTLLNHPIKTPADVEAWAKSIFNVGPVHPDEPLHISDTKDLVCEDFVIGSGPYVVPAGQRGSGNGAVVTFDEPYGKRRRLGPRSEEAKTAFAAQKPQKAPRPSQEQREHTVRTRRTRTVQKAVAELQEPSAPIGEEPVATITPIRPEAEPVPSWNGGGLEIETPVTEPTEATKKLLRRNPVT